MGAQPAANLLAAFYAAEVRNRGRDVIWDAPTVAHITALAEFITSDDVHHGVMFLGSVGNGKTTLMRAFQAAINYLDVRERHFHFMDDPYTGTPCHPRLDFYDARALAEKVKDKKRFDAVKNTMLLAIDDLGTDPGQKLDYGNVLTPMSELLEYRYSRDLFTIITTNLDANEMEQKYDGRIRDRMREMFARIIFEQDSYRC